MSASDSSGGGAGPPRDTADALPAGTRLAEFELRSVLGLGGFGIVYQAWDHALEREVALKEYMPAALAHRGAGERVTLRSRADEETFAIGLRSFVNEARLLARFDHPSLVKVYRFWEDHGTAYMVMPCYRGRTLREVRQAMAEPPDEAACRRLLLPLLSALELLHREGVYHRDIAPDNVLVGDDGVPVLLDFGAARRVIGRQQALTAILKPNFAPLEQYADMSSMQQGAWTDLYALGATMYFFLTGRAPLPAAARALRDELPPLASLAPPGCSQPFLQALDWTLALRPPERPQAVAVLRAALEGRATPPRPPAGEITVPSVTTRDVTGVHVGAVGPVGHEARHDPVAATVPAALDASPEPAPAASPAPPVDAGSAAAPRGDGGVRVAAVEVDFDPTQVPPPSPWSRARTMVAASTVVLALGAWWMLAPQPSSTAASAMAPTDFPAATTPVATAGGPSLGSAPSAEALPVTQAVPGRGSLPPGDTAPVVVAPQAVRATAVGEPEPRARVEPRPRPAPVRARAAREDVEGPRERCGDRMFLARLECMRRECERPALAAHAECRRMATMEREALARQQP